MGGKTPFFAPPIIRREFFNFVYLKNKHERKQKQRQQYKENGKTEYILNERCKFFLKLSMTKKKVVINFGENRRELFQDYLSKSKFALNFCPPNICDPSFCPPNILEPNFCPPLLMPTLRRC